MTRSRLLLSQVAVCLMTSPLALAAEPAASKAPFHVLYSNDLTNIVGCPSPYNPKGSGFKEPMLRASVDETAGTGVEVHMLQPGLGWVPWWQSKILPMSEHLRYLQSVGRKPDSFESYVGKGGDVVKIFVEECRAKGLVPFISMRMNDAHHIRRGLAEKDAASQEKAMAEFQYFVDHPEYRLGVESPDRSYQNLFDWAHPEVRQYKLSFLQELCENYDLDGLELDFMRHPILFKKQTPVEQRRAIMTDFIKQTRVLLDRTSTRGRHRWLCVHIPGYVSDYDALGIDLGAWAAAGIEMVNVSGYYFNDQQMEIGEIRRQLPPNVAVYDELHYASAVRRIAAKFPFSLRRSTDPEFYTTAHLASARGADGVSAFNFQYYRGTTNKNDVAGTPAEPPFHIFKHLGDRNWIARQPQEYFVGGAWGKLYKPGRLRYFDSPLKQGMTEAVGLDMTPPAHGWLKEGRLRIQADDSLRNSHFTASINGMALKPTEDVSELYPNPYDVALGKPEDYRAWIVSPSVLKDGINDIVIRLTEGGPAQIFFLDVTMP